MKILYQVIPLSCFCLLSVAGLYLFPASTAKASAYDEEIVMTGAGLRIDSYPSIMFVGETDAVKATSGYGWSYESSNPEIISVGDRGSLKALAPGKATITVYDGSGITSQRESITIEVYEKRFTFTPPDKLVYQIGEPLDWTGIYAEAIGIDGYSSRDNYSYHDDKWHVKLDASMLPDTIESFFYTADDNFCVTAYTFDNQKPGEYLIRVYCDRAKESSLPISHYYEASFTVEVVDSDSVSPGDIDANGTIDILDVIQLNKALFGKTSLTDAQAQTADVNHNGKPDFSDSLMIMRYIVKLIDDFS